MPGENVGSCVDIEPITRFGPFRLDQGTHQLWKGDDVRHLTPKAFDLLALLARRAPCVVTRTALHENLWPDTFVCDATLSSLIKELRRVLGDHDRSAPILRTVNRVGYALAVAVERELSTSVVVADRYLVVDGLHLRLRPGVSTIGRDAACDIRLDAPSVSRRHAVILNTGAGDDVEDLGSKNGTCVNGERITDARALRDRDRLSIGAVLATYRAAKDGATTQTSTKNANRLGASTCERRSSRP